MHDTGLLAAAEHSQNDTSAPHSSVHMGLQVLASLHLTAIKDSPKGCPEPTLASLTCLANSFRYLLSTLLSSNCMAQYFMWQPCLVKGAQGSGAGVKKCSTL